MKKKIFATLLLAGMVFGTEQAVFAADPTGYQTYDNLEGKVYGDTKGLEIPVNGTLGKINPTNPENNRNPNTRVSYPWDSFNPNQQGCMRNLVQREFRPKWDAIVDRTTKQPLGWEKNSSIVVDVNSPWSGEAYSGCWLDPLGTSYMYADPKYDYLFGYSNIQLYSRANEFSIELIKKNDRVNQFKIIRKKESGYDLDPQLGILGTIMFDSKSDPNAYKNSGLAYSNGPSVYWYVYDKVEFSDFPPTRLNNTIVSPPTLKIGATNKKEIVSVGDQLKSPESYYKIIQSMNRSKTSKFITPPDFSKPGNTTGIIEVTERTDDGYEQKANVVINFEVKEISSPELEAHDIEVLQYSVFDPYDKQIGLKAVDKKDGDLTSKIKVEENKVNTKKLGSYPVTYSVTNSSGKTTKKTIQVKVAPKDTWVEGDTDGWKFFSGENLTLVEDPDNVLVGTHSFYSDKHVALYKQLDTLEEGKEYRATVYFKPVDKNLNDHYVKMSLKEDLAGPDSKTIFNTTLSQADPSIKGYYEVTSTFTVGKGEKHPLIVIENFKEGYIGSIYIAKIN